MSTIKLLLVDDEADYVRAMAERLALRDVDSQVALSGEEALRAVDEDEPHVMVLDLRMPGIDGMEVLERVKREHPHVQVIVLTGRGSEADEAAARELGAFEYLEKPTDTGELLDTIRSAWTKALDLVKQSGKQFTRSMTAAAAAEGGADLALEYMEEEEAADAAEESAASAASAAESEASLKVLYVDDEEDFVQTLAERMRMREVGGDVALGGEEALEMLELETERPDVMVLDIQMPGLDGLEVLRRVKRQYPEIQVVILTGHGSKKDEAEARRLGAFDYLRKPVEIEELMETVRRAARAPRTSAEADRAPGEAG
ncbi:MAG: response regulator [Gemmatimonadota bacterium]